MSVTGTLGRSDAWLEIKIHKWQLTNGMFCYIIIIIIILRRGISLIMTCSPCEYLSSEEESIWVWQAFGWAKSKKKLGFGPVAVRAHFLTSFPSQMANEYFTRVPAYLT